MLLGDMLPGRQEYWMLFKPLTMSYTQHTTGTFEKKQTHTEHMVSVAISGGVEVMETLIDVFLSAFYVFVFYYCYCSDHILILLIGNMAYDR